MKRLLLISLCISGAGCGYDRFDDTLPVRHTQQLHANMLLSDFVEYYRDGKTRVTSDQLFFGYVTSSDREGNFSGTLVMEHDGAAVEIITGIYDTWTLYPPGSRLHVHALGLVFSCERGVATLGYDAARGYVPASGAFGYRPLLERYVVADGNVAPVEPRTLDVSQLDQAMCGTLVRVPGLSYRGTPGDRWGRESDTYREFSADGGETVMVMVSSRAAFARTAIPSGEVAICGILRRLSAADPTGDRQASFVLQPRGAEDVAAKSAGNRIFDE